MRAILMKQTGGPEVLEPSKLPKPALPGPNHVLVRLHAAGINPIDTKLRKNGTYFPNNLPAILGCDGAGVVEETGENVTRLKNGDEVFFFNGGIGKDQGNYAEYTVIHEDYAALKPRSISMEQAAAVPLVFITAWEALFDRGHLEKGDTVLIHAGAGGVGHVAIQLAKQAGAFVATTISDDDKEAFVKSLGADLVINYKEQDFAKACLDWTEDQGVDLTFDTVGSATFCQSFAATSVYGKVVTLLQTPCEPDAIKLARLRNQSIIYELMLTPSVLDMHQARCNQRIMLEEASKMIDDGKLSIKLKEVLPLEEAAKAHTLIEQGHLSGKIVLRI